MRRLRENTASRSTRPRLESAFREVWRARPARPPSSGPRDDDDRPWWRALALDVLRAASPAASNIDGEAWFERALYAFRAAGGLASLRGREKMPRPTAGTLSPGRDLEFRSDGCTVFSMTSASCAKFEQHFHLERTRLRKARSRPFFEQALESMNVGTRTVHSCGGRSRT